MSSVSNVTTSSLLRQRRDRWQRRHTCHRCFKLFLLSEIKQCHFYSLAPLVLTPASLKTFLTEPFGPSLCSLKRSIGNLAFGKKFGSMLPYSLAPLVLTPASLKTLLTRTARGLAAPFQFLAVPDIPRAQSSTA